MKRIMLLFSIAAICSTASNLMYSMDSRVKRLGNALSKCIKESGRTPSQEEQKVLDTDKYGGRTRDALYNCLISQGLTKKEVSERLESIDPTSSSVGAFTYQPMNISSTFNVR